MYATHLNRGRAILRLLSEQRDVDTSHTALTTEVNSQQWTSTQGKTAVQTVAETQQQLWVHLMVLIFLD